LLSQWLTKPKEVEPYSKLAFIYDFVMRHVDYQSWAQYLNSLFLKADIPVRRILDIACGTASLLLQLHRLDFEVAGFDASENMVRMARDKIKGTDTKIPIWQGNMRNFKVRKPFDVCICTYDSMNYCLQAEECIKVLMCVSEALYPGGLFIFDICTEKNSRKYFNSYYENDSTDDFSYVRQSRYSKDEEMQVNEFVITFNSSKTSSFRELHHQRIYRINEISNLIPGSMFKLVGIYEGFSRRPGTEQSNRVHFVLKKT
jgi:ubiquinone/menaquinone biosynthesis C-methylase UbiE